MWGATAGSGHVLKSPKFIKKNELLICQPEGRDLFLHKPKISSGSKLFKFALK